MNQACNNAKCNNVGKKLSLCSGCNSARYCSKECQKSDWPSHKDVCKFPALGHLAKEIKKSREKGIPLCIHCENMLLLCNCKRSNESDGVVFTVSEALTLEQRDKNFQKWVKKLTQMKSKFQAAIFYKDFSAIVSTIMRVEPTLKRMAKTYAIKGYKDTEVNLFKDWPAPDVRVYVTVAASKFADCAFAEMSHLELMVCTHMYKSIPRKDAPLAIAEDLQKTFDLVSALEIAARNTLNWPNVTDTQQNLFGTIYFRTPPTVCSTKVKNVSTAKAKEIKVVHSPVADITRDVDVFDVGQLDATNTIRGTWCVGQQYMGGTFVLQFNRPK